MNRNDQENLASWFEKELDGSLESVEFEQLQKMLVENPDARELYLDLKQQHAHFQLEGIPLATNVHSHQRPDQLVRNRPSPLRNKIWFAGLVTACSLLLMAWWSIPSVFQSKQVIAHLTDSSDALWGDCSLPTMLGSQLEPGQLKLNRGIATILFASGAELTLEAPAELEIESPLSGRLVRGTAVVEVPDSAHGFTLKTPTAVAIDYGTSFAATVDDTSQTSAIEVLEGEVEVQHVRSSQSIRLKEKHAVVATESGLSDSKLALVEANLLGPTRSEAALERYVRITTADGAGSDATVQRDPEAESTNTSSTDLVLIKNPYQGFEGYSRKGYFSFDLSGLPRAEITAAKFVLNLRPSGIGFASKVDDCTFVVYCLADEELENWSTETLTWQNAPANHERADQVNSELASEVGRFKIGRGVQHGQFFVEGKALTEVLNANTNQKVTLIVVRETIESEPGGLVHGFVSSSSALGSPPALLLQLRPESQ